MCCPYRQHFLFLPAAAGTRFPYRRNTGPMTMPRGLFQAVSCFCVLLVVSLNVTRAVCAQNGALHTLIVGGGPERKENQVAIESNVRYVGSLLPPQADRITLFADGNPHSRTVLYDVDEHAIEPGQRVLDLLLADTAADPGSHYRRPQLGAPLDGAATRAEIAKAFARLAGNITAPDPLFLYCTGHGSPNERDGENNQFDLWEGANPNEAISVRELAQQIARLPAAVPVTIVMVQCFSGAFGNLIFEGGDPHGAPVGRDLAGFFAAVNNRPAAGCTSAVNEAEYKDFTSYFFAALTGRDRMGRRVTGADYNGDGRVGMDEAYCYTLAHDASIDVPVCTSDVFLRRFVPMHENEVFANLYADVAGWATPAQRAALDELSRRAHLTGDGRVERAYRDLMDSPATTTVRHGPRHLALARQFDTLQKQGRESVLARWPALARPGSTGYPAAVREAARELNRQVQAGRWKALMSADDALDKAVHAAENREIAESYQMRFVRLCKSIVLAHQLRETGQPDIQARFKSLIAAEGRTLLPPATPS